jgi:hypothetical protein
LSCTCANFVTERRTRIGFATFCPNAVTIVGTGGHVRRNTHEDDPLGRRRSWAILEGEKGCVGMIDAPDPDTALDEWALLHRDGNDAGLTAATVEDAL